MKITLTHEQYEELLTLEEGETIEVEFNGIDAFITPDPYGNIEYRGRKFTFNFFCPSEVTLSVKRAEKKAEEPKAEVKEEENTKTIIGAEFEQNKMHIYDVKTNGAHPVHLIDGGAIITEEEGEFDDDMGWYWLNTREYEYFKSQCHKIVLE